MDVSRTIWKYDVAITDTFALEMPAGAQLLDVQVQHEGGAQLWALVNPTQPTNMRVFRLVGTGHSVPDERLQYVGTFQLHGGALVFHLFEVIEL